MACSCVLSGKRPGQLPWSPTACQSVAEPLLPGSFCFLSPYSSWTPAVDDKSLSCFFCSPDSLCLLSSVLLARVCFTTSSRRKNYMLEKYRQHMFNNKSIGNCPKWWPCKAVLTWETCSESLILGSKINIWLSFSLSSLSHIDPLIYFNSKE